MDSNFLKAHADLCRGLADTADQFTKRRLLDLAADYERRLLLSFFLHLNTPRPLRNEQNVTQVPGREASLARQQRIFKPRFANAGLRTYEA